MTRSRSVGVEGSGPQHLAALDGVRGVAVLLVIFFHATILPVPFLRPGLVIDDVVWRSALTGWAGVDLFFVLSGFLITGILLDTRHGNSYFKSFYARRFLRIFPLYYGFLFAFLVVVPHLAPRLVRDPSQLHRYQAWFWAYLTNIGMAVHPDFTTLPHFWSLAVEEQFYLLWPSVVWFLDGTALRRVALALLVVPLALRVGLLMAGVRPEAVFLLTPTRMDALAAGALVAIGLREPAGVERIRGLARVLGWSGLAAVGAIVLARGTLREYDPVVQTVGFSALAIGFAALVARLVTTTSAGVFDRVMRWGWLRYFGLRSYALYVVHPVALIVAVRYAHADALPTLGSSGIVAQVYFWAVCLALSVAIAETSWRLLERPCLSLKRLFPYARPVRVQISQS